MNFKISERTKLELLVGLIFCLTLIWFAQSLENSWQEKRLEELKEEKTKLEIRNNELFKIYEEVSFDPQETASADNYHSGAGLNRQEREADVSAVIDGEIREISWYSELDSCHYPKAGKCLVASGKIAKVGMVATWAYEIGTKLEIDGKIYTVEDRTNREYGHRIDIFTGYGDQAYQLAKANGIQYKNVKVLN